MIWFKRKKTPTHVLVESMARLIQDDPEGWTYGTHSIGHEALAVGLWIANDAWGTSIYVEIKPEDIKKFKGHVLSGRKITLPPDEREKLFALYKDHADYHDRKAHADQAQKINDYLTKQRELNDH